MSAPELTGHQRTYLRGKAHDLEPVVLVADTGITDGVIRAVDRALSDHELIKVKMRRPEDKAAMAEELATRTSSALCGLIGHTAILYRPHPEKPRLHLPQR